MTSSEATSQQSPEPTQPGAQSGAQPGVPAGTVDAEQAQAALAEHYPRLVRLAYLALPASLGRHRRVLTAHSLVQGALPWGRAAVDVPPLPGQRDGGAESGGGAPRGAAYRCLVERVLRAALRGERPRRFSLWRLRTKDPWGGALPLVLGLRLLPRAGGAYELALDDALSELSGAARAACALRCWEGLTDGETRRVLEAAGVERPAEALAQSADLRLPGGPAAPGLAPAPTEFDPCTLQARPTDLLKRRRHRRAAAVAVAALLVCGGLLGLPGDGAWGPDGPAAPPYAQNPAAEQALKPSELTRVSADAWRNSPRRDFSVWPARGELTRDQGLLRRALAVWARPGDEVQVSATPGAAAGPPPGPPRLLYAGEVDGARVVLLHDGLRAVRYAEPAGEGGGRAVLDIARTDGADTADSGALVISRSDSNVRYLTAPWVRKAAEVDLLHRGDEGRRLRRAADGVLASLTAPRPGPGVCQRWPGLLLTSRDGGTGGDGASGSKRRLYTDLGELTVARLTSGNPRGTLKEATGEGARRTLSHTACGFRGLLGGGVRTVNSWKFATQWLPGGTGRAVWSCTRGETWSGEDARIFTGFRRTGAAPGAQAQFPSRGSGTPACGPRRPHALGGTVWTSDTGDRYVLAAGSRKVASIAVHGESGVTSGSWQGRRLALPAKKNASAKLAGRLEDGRKLSMK